MASISDVFDALNDVKGKLDQLHADNLNHNVLIEATNTKLDALDQSVASLETTLDGRLLSMLQEQQLGNQLLLHLTKQQETVICGIEQISRNTCTLVNLASEQLVETRQVRENTRVSADILSSAHPDAALDLSRRDRLQEQIEECCPPKPSEPICRYEPCKDPGPFKEPRKPKRGPDREQPNRRPPCRKTSGSGFFEGALRQDAVCLLKLDPLILHGWIGIDHSFQRCLTSV